MTEKEINDYRLEYLKGNVWPSIQQCVKNRELILVGVTGFFGYAYKSVLPSLLVIFFGSCMLLLIGLNYLNYKLNADDQEAMIPEKVIPGRKRAVNFYYTILMYVIVIAVSVFVAVKNNSTQKPEPNNTEIKSE